MTSLTPSAPGPEVGQVLNLSPGISQHLHLPLTTDGPLMREPDVISSTMMWSTMSPENLTLDESESLLNGTNFTTGYIPWSQRPETYFVPTIFALIFVVGVIGNGTLIVIFVRNPTLRNVPNTYIISLALGDLLVLFFTVPFVSTIYTLESWPYGEFECKFSEFVRDISVGVTVFTLTALSADRYLAIVSPVRK
ncbi:unnamed protein product, partial [Meganyctiphanes norvegica]